MRHVQIRLEDEEYEEFARKAERRGGLQAAGREALVTWSGGKAPTPFGEISRDEERLLRAMLRYSREAPASDLLKQAIPALIRLWGPK
jgi:hypothetical protein